jgi:hypothetical protein
LSNFWFQTFCSLDYDTRLLFYNELKTISSLFLLLAHGKKTIEDLFNNIITYMYYDYDNNNLRQEFGKLTNTDPFIDQFKSTLSNSKVQYEKDGDIEYKEGDWFFSTINYDSFINGNYLEQFYIKQMRLTNINNKNFKFINAPKIIVLSSDQKSMNLCFIVLLMTYSVYSMII